MLSLRLHPRPLAARSLQGLALLITLTALPASSRQLAPRLVADLRPNTEPASSELTHVTGIGDITLFTVDNSQSGLSGLWRSDGTPTGTFRLGTSNGNIPSYRLPIAIVDGFLYFGDLGNSLWRTDGSLAGTTRIATNLYPLNYVAAIPGGPLLFQGRRTGQPPALWRTDGTPAGTWRVSDDLAQVGFGKILGGQAIFPAKGLGLGTELWRSDGTADGTSLIADLDPGIYSSFPAGLFRAGVALVFSAEKQAEGSSQKWRSDGTADGTYPLTDLPETGSDSFPSGRYATNLDPLSPIGLFIGGSTAEPPGLWATDGTISGTLRLTGADVGAGTPAYVSAPGIFAFQARSQETGLEHWLTDGTPAGTRLLIDACPGACSGADQLGLGTARPGLFRLNANDGVHGVEPWISDGTAVGSRMLADLCTGPCSSSPSFFVPTATSTLFVARTADSTWRLFRTDWTPDGTVALFDGKQPFELADDSWFRNTPSGMIFTARDDEHGRELWHSDGTVGGTSLAADVSPGFIGASSSPGELAARGDAIYFIADDGDGEELWRSNGSSNGTRAVTEGAAPTGWELRQLTATPSLLFFIARHSDGQQHVIWCSDGTTAGTRQLTAFESDPYGPELLTAVVGERFFLLGPGLWTSDGTPGGTLQLAADVDSSLETAALGDELVFLRGPGGTARELWRTDGTVPGTQPLLGSSPPFHGPRHLLTFADRLYFTATPNNGYTAGLWSTDGTVGGTAPVPASDGLRPWTVVGGRLLVISTGMYQPIDLRSISGPTVTPTHLRQLPADNEGTPRAVELDGKAYFLSAAPGHADLWQSDGTLDGTYVSELVPLAHNTYSLATVAGRLFVVSHFDTWLTDGSSPAVLVSTEPHVQGSLAAVGDLVLFPATTRELGTELWSLDLAAPPSTLPAAPSDLVATVLDANTVELQWTDHAVDELGFQVEVRSPEDDWSTVHVAPANTTVTGIVRFGAGMPYTFRVRANNAAGASPPSNEASATMPGSVYDPPPCSTGDTELCLHQESIDVRVHWRNQRTGDHDVGHATPFPGSSRSGTFWFFGADNVELIVKVLDGRGVNGHYWTFWGGLSDVEYWVTVTETRSGNTATYHNPPGAICGGADVRSLPSITANPAPALTAEQVSLSPAVGTAGLAPGTHLGSATILPLAASGSCAPASDALCLLDGRFRVTVDWRDQRTGNTGNGAALPGTDQSGYFWFFDAGNVELVVKALDGRPINGKHWIFYGALSDVEYTIRVTDTATGAVRTYRNPPGEICGAADVDAF